MADHLFDVSLWAAVRVDADTAENARTRLAGQIECNRVCLGELDDGTALFGEVSVDPLGPHQPDGIAYAGADDAVDLEVPAARTTTVIGRDDTLCVLSGFGIDEPVHRRVHYRNSDSADLCSEVTVGQMKIEVFDHLGMSDAVTVSYRDNSIVIAVSDPGETDTEFVVPLRAQ